MTADRWAHLHVLLPRLADLVEILVRAKHAAAEPDSVPLHHVLSHLTRHGRVCVGDGVVDLHASVKDSLHLLLQSLVKAIEKCAASTEHNVVIESDSVVNGAPLDGIVDHLTKRLREIFVNEFLQAIKRGVVSE